jgi:uncharacterized protein YbjT (DUF2867 family)
MSPSDSGGSEQGVADPAALSRVAGGSEAVVSAVWGHAKGSPKDVLARGTANVIAAMRANGVKRLVVLSSPADADAADRPGLVYRAARVLLRVVIPGAVQDHREQARVVEESGLAWTLVRGPLPFATARAPAASTQARSGAVPGSAPPTSPHSCSKPRPAAASCR